MDLIAALSLSVSACAGGGDDGQNDPPAQNEGDNGGGGQSQNGDDDDNGSDDDETVTAMVATTATTAMTRMMTTTRVLRELPGARRGCSHSRSCSCFALALKFSDLQFAHYVAESYREAGYEQIQARAEVRASLNGREPRPLLNSGTDLAAWERTLAPSRWISSGEALQKLTGSGAAEL